MESAWEFIKQLMSPESIIHHGGLILLLLVIFAENGLVIGFFLPGDSLIFLAGLITSTEKNPLPVEITGLILCMFGAAVLGSLFGYVFGLRVGPPLFQRKESMIFKRKYLDVTQAFYNKHGGKTLVLGRFLPIIRTFAPIIAGVIKVPFLNFMFFNLVGGALWIGSLGLIGYYIGFKYPAVENYLGYIIVGFIGVTSIIVMRSYIKHRREMAASKEKSVS